MLAALFILVPIAEIYLIIEVGSWFGTLPTIAIIVVTALVGAALAKNQGLVAVRKLQRSLSEGREVARSIVEAVLVLAAAIAMLTPGFLTDLAGLALLVPAVRSRIAAVVERRLAARIRLQQVVINPRHWDNDDDPPPGVIDV